MCPQSPFGPRLLPTIPATRLRDFDRALAMYRHVSEDTTLDAYTRAIAGLRLTRLRREWEAFQQRRPRD